MVCDASIIPACPEKIIGQGKKKVVFQVDIAMCKECQDVFKKLTPKKKNNPKQSKNKS